MADAPAEAPAPKKKKSSLGKQVTSGVRATVDAGRTVLSTMERGVKKTYDALLKENLKASSPMTKTGRRGATRRGVVRCDATSRPTRPDAAKCEVWALPAPKS